MIEVVGIFGCVSAAVAAGVIAGLSVALSAISLGYGISSSLDSAEQMDTANLKNEERAAIQERLANSQNKKALIKAAQMAATGTLMDRIMEGNFERKTNAALSRMHTTNGSNGTVPRSERHYGNNVRM